MYNGFAEFLYYIRLYKEFFDSQINYWVVFGAPALGAFFGAFLAFCSTQYHYQLTQRQRHWKRHMDSLCQLEMLLNQNMEYLNRNEVTLVTIRKLKSHNFDERVVGWVNFNELQSEWSVFADNLRNNKLLNLLLSYFLKVSKTNNDNSLVLGMIDDLRHAQFAKHIEAKNSHQLLEDIPLNDLENWRKLMVEQTTQLLCYVRVVLRKDDKPHPVWHFVKKIRSSDPTEQELIQMRSKLDMELEIVQKKSRREIDDALGHSI